MNGNVRLLVFLSGLAFTALPLSQSQAQFYGGNPCQCVQPVVQPCYQTVPVTEYRTEKQTVQRPIYETAYVDEPVTEYRPVTEVKTASVPYTTYQDVVECQTMQRDYGRWVTQYQPRQMVSACQYDGSPTITGWLNRSAYSIRNSFKPRYTVSRQYVPNVVAYNVPVTRRIPITASRQVNYNVTRMVPYTTTRKVAVNKVRYETVQVDVVRPVTVMRTVPTGTSVAYSYSPYGSATAFAPTPVPDANTAELQKVPQRTADSSTNNGTSSKFTREKDGDDADHESSSTDKLINDNRTFTKPIVKERTVPKVSREADGHVSGSVEHSVAFRPSVPSVVRVSGWRARHQSHDAKGPELAAPQVEMARNR